MAKFDFSIFANFSPEMFFIRPLVFPVKALENCRFLKIDNFDDFGFKSRNYAKIAIFEGL